MFEIPTPRIDTAYLTQIRHDEKTWIDSLAHPFSSHHTNGGYEVFMLQDHHHPDFNPFCSMIFYVQETHVGERETPANTRGNRIYYIHQPMFKPTGTFSVDRQAQTMTCVDGILHDASGNPAMTTELFGPAYYLHGSHYEPIEYFRLMEDQRKHRPDWFYMRYPEYDPSKYIEFMAGVLGRKN